MDRRHCWTRWSVALLTLTLAACNGDGGAGLGDPNDVTPPTIVSTLPVSSASGVARTTAVAVTFSETVIPAAGGAATLSLSATTLPVPVPVTGTVTFAGPLVTFTPAVPLALNTQFTARVDVGLTDLSGNALATPFVFNFTSEPVPWPGTRQLGTLTADTGNAVATDDAGNAYVAGTTRGDLAGPSLGGADCFLAKFDLSGNRTFTSQFGTSADDEAFAVAVDGAGNSYVAGSTAGDLDGPGIGSDPLIGASDFFLAKFGPTGNLLFTRQIGTSANDEARGVAVDGVGNIYVTGMTSGDLDGPGIGSDPFVGATDFFLAKFDSSGNLLFTRQIGTSSNDQAFAMALDGVGNVYVTGSTAGDLDGPGIGSDPLVGATDFFLAKFGPTGNLLFTRQLGTLAADEARGVAVDGVGNIFVTGTTGQDLDGPLIGDPFVGATDFFLAKFGPSGSLLFTRQLGTLADDRGFAVAVDGAGNVYVTGTTAGDLDGPGVDPFVGGTDIFLAKFGSSGNLLFTRQLGTLVNDASFGVAVAGLAVGGNIFVTGETLGDLDDNLSAGGLDIFLSKFDPFGILQ
jgi:hypothetical protein